jgi:hypothetical protein
MAADRTVIRKGPYLQDLGPNGVSVRVEVMPATSATLEVTEQVAAGPPAQTRVIASPEAFTVHTLRVTDLKPRTTYAYRVKSAGAVQSGTFRTAPDPMSTEPFSFAIYGDNRSDDVAHAAVIRAMTQFPSDFLLHTGDFVESGSNPANWQSFFDIESTLLRGTCVFACVGNHELIETDALAYLRYFGPVSDARGTDQKPALYGSFRWGNTRFFLLNAMDEWAAGPERAWFEADLQRADAEPGLTWRVVVLHHSPWSSGPHGGNTRFVRARLPELLALHKVDLVVAGHDHIYERGVEAGLRYLISGGGGAPLYPVRAPLDGTRKVESVHHFVEATVAADTVTLVARRVDGSVLERCGFNKRIPAWDCDPQPSLSVVAPASPAQPVEDASRGRASRCGCRVVGDPEGGAGEPLRGPAWLAVSALGVVLVARRARRR